VPAGKYGLLTIPDKAEWTIILTKQLDVTSPAAYKQENDVVRVKAKPMAIAMPLETFTIQFANVKPSSTDLQIMWDKTAVSLPISADVDSKVMAQIKTAMTTDKPPYFQAAAYYLENGKDLNQAITWFDKAVEQQPDAYWIHHQKAIALVKLGRKEEAKQAAQKSMELAKKQNNNDYVTLNQKLIASL
jgi:tetratricopeptide (TPR) repeat protein